MAEKVRQDLVEEARKFLLNPKVLTEKDENKRAFLMKKGLTEEEINVAFSMVPKNMMMSHSASSPSFGPPVPYIPQQPSSRWSQVRDYANLVLILSGASYGIHYIYKCYIGPLLTGHREKSVEESMIELQHSVATVLKDVQNTLSTLEQTLSAQTIKIQAINNEKTTATDAATRLQLDDLKTEITSLKGLLVNKRSFPAPPSLSAGIPSWQLSSASGAISNATVNNTSSVASSQANDGSVNSLKESATVTNGSNVVNTNSLKESNAFTNGLNVVSTNSATENITMTNDINVVSNITNGHSNKSTEDDVLDDDSIVEITETNESSISSMNVSKTHDTQDTERNTDLESSEKDQINSHSNDVIKNEFDDTSEKRGTVEDTIITDSSDEISQ